MKTKKEIKELYEAGKLKDLMSFIISDGTKSDIINALQLMLKKGSEEYEIKFESIPYSRGGRYARHTSTLHSTQKWEIIERDTFGYYVRTSSTSKSGACPPVIVPKFCTENGKAAHNAAIQVKIEELKKQLL